MAKDIKTMLAKKIAENTARHASAVQEVDLDLGKRHEKIRLDLIDPNPFQPRRAFPEDELASLTASIRASGLLQPITLRRVGERYQIIAGERRVRAVQLLPESHIEALIVQASDEEMAVLALVENIDREDLSDYEIGRGIRQIEAFFPSKTNLAESLGKDRKDLYRYLAFFALPESIIARLEANPRVLGRAAAEKLKACLKKLDGAENLEVVLHQAWSDLEAGRVDQLKLPSHIESAIKESGERPERKESETALLRGGTKVGAVRRKGRNLIVTLDTSAFTDNQQTELLAFIQQLAGEGG